MATNSSGADAPPETTPALDALHEVEVGTEWIRRAHGHLLAFHHAIGHGMEHYAAAEDTFRATGNDRLADAIRDDVLPRGVIDGDRWSYDVVETFEADFLDPVADVEADARDAITDGKRHVRERHQRRRWRDRAEE
jgi:hypothetical protein